MKKSKIKLLSSISVLFVMKASMKTVQMDLNRKVYFQPKRSLLKKTLTTARAEPLSSVMTTEIAFQDSTLMQRLIKLYWKWCSTNQIKLMALNKLQYLCMLQTHLKLLMYQKILKTLPNKPFSQRRHQSSLLLITILKVRIRCIDRISRSP